MQGKRIAVLESRFGEGVVALLEKKGAITLHAPALAEEPDVDSKMIQQLLDEWTARPFVLAIFQTGVGTRALFEAADRLGMTDSLLSLLANCKVAVRGPKPAAALRARQVRIDLSALEPYTTVEVLELIQGFDLAGKRVLVQRYGETNLGLQAALDARRADVVELPTYRWALPADTRPLERLVDGLAHGQIDAAIFTSASQVRNLFAIAAQHEVTESLRRSLNAVLVASIGPVCSRALRAAGVCVSLEASPPKLGPLLEMLDKAWPT
jgi:uroporphyrinogen-III synthase